MSDQLPDVDNAALEALRELMQEDYPLLLETFLGDAKLRLSQLREALVNEDLEAYRQAAHSFKGSCGNMGALALERACLNAENAALQGDTADASYCYSRIRERFTRLQAQLS
ncbi:MAG: Hpt domain-containing protein [Halopseudomonas sp.]|uniref:Hpt domain-containing protein n=1 Tax=Halopseudomonas sp. TaxID=2901191 RepID=UPI0030025556